MGSRSIVSGTCLRPVLAALLLVIGLRILVRFSRVMTVRAPDSEGENGVPSFDEDSGRQRKQARKPSRSAVAALEKNRQRPRPGVRAGQTGRQ